MILTTRSFTLRCWILAMLLCAMVLVPCLQASAAEQTTLTFLLWSSDPADQDSQKQRARLFEAENPGVKVEVLFSGSTTEQREKILTMHAAGIAPDLYVVSRPYQYELWANGTIQPVTKFVNDPELRFRDIVNTEQLHMDGEYIGIPHHGGGQQLAFNAELFAVAGIERADALYKAGRWDITAFQEVARKITRDTNGDGVPDIYGVSGLTHYHSFLSFLRAFGATLLDPNTGDPRINTPQGVEAIRFVSELRTVYDVVGGKSQAGTQAMWNQCPRCVFRDWGRPEVFPFEWNIVPYPKANGGHKDVGGHNFYAISSQCKHPELAFAFIKFELRPELIRQQLSSGAILTPVRASTFRDPVLRNRFPGLNLDVFLLATSDYLVPETVKVPGLDEAQKISNREVGDAAKGLQSAEQAAVRIHEEIVRAVLPRYRKQ